jgi:hypothetical protein
VATYRPGRLTAVLVDKMDASPFLNTSDWSSKLGTADVTHYGSTAKEFIPGLGEASLTLGGMLDGASSVSVPTYDSLTDSFMALTTNYPVTMCFDGGIQPGRRCAITPSIQTNYTISTPVANVAAVKMSITCNGRPGDGYVLTDATPETTAATLNYASVDNGVSTPGGGYAAFHIVANTWTGNTTVKIQHSSDNSVWVDLISQVVPATTQIAYLPTVAGTVNRYIRAQVITAAGSGSVNAIAAFART